MATLLPTTDHASNSGAAIDYERFLDCVHCGLCTASCPTYLETGNENDSPRGRIHLMRAVTDRRMELSNQVRRHLELCLDCRACETACPSGVQYGRLIEPFRVAMDKANGESQPDWFHRWILFRLFPYPGRLRKALVPARIAQKLKLDRLLEFTQLIRLLPPQLQQMIRALPPPMADEGPLPEFLPALGPKRASVALFTGCIGDAMFRHTNWATARVLQHNGCDVHVPRTQVCCGAIHYHAGSDQPAREFAGANLDAFEDPRFDVIINNIAGCGSMLKDYGHHWHDELRPRRQSFAAKVRDVNEFLAALGPAPPKGPIPLVATYHDACHLAHAQQIREAPRKLLALIPGLELRPLVESEVCCGAAGSYNLTQPEMAGQLGERKLQHILATGASAVITSNAGCIMQIAREAREHGERLPVYHPMELLDWSYRGLQPQT
jgi:glycolate oxidase iron-sulfur subunit